MAKFKVGDRVRVYEGAGSWKGEVTWVNSDSDTLVILHAENAFNQRVHVKQCRKLVKKNKDKEAAKEGTLFIDTSIDGKNWVSNGGDDLRACRSGYRRFRFEPKK